MDKRLLQILQHSLGVDEFGQGAQYRNHFVAGGDDVAKCRELVAMDFMAEYEGSALSGGSPVFKVTREGKNAVAEFSPKCPPPPKLTRAQKRYRDYLEVSECFDNFLHYCRYADHREKEARYGT